MKIFISLLTAPLLSSFLMMAGASLLTTIISLRLNGAGYSNVDIALVASSYYIGMLLGSFKVEKLITRVGHGRSFSVFISILTVSAMVPLLFDWQVLWMASRAACGFALAGMYVVLESWILSVTTSNYRARFMSLYMIALSLGAVGGQQCVSIAGTQSLMPFCIVALMLSLATLPFSLTKTKAPHIEEASALSFKQIFKCAPVGFWGCVLSGILVGSMFSLYPVVFQDARFSLFEISQIIASLNIGGLLLNYPFGWLCDHKNRLYVMIGLIAMALLGSFYLCVGSLSFGIDTLGATFLFGGAAIVIYTVAVGIATSEVAHENITKTAQVMVFAYCLGGIIGPVTGALAMNLNPTRGIFYMAFLFLSIFMGFLIQQALKAKNLLPQTAREEAA